MPDLILSFRSNADTIIATKTLKDRGIAAKMMPKPVSVDAGANLCLSLDSALERPATQALEDAGIAIDVVSKT